MTKLYTEGTKLYNWRIKQNLMDICGKKIQIFDSSVWRWHKHKEGYFPSYQGLGREDV